MFGSARATPLLNREQEDWQLACWRWLIDAFSSVRPLQSTALVVPSFEFFPESTATGHALAIHLFDHTARLMSVEPNAFDLIAHNDFPEDSAGRTPRGQYAAGTFSMPTGDRMLISYHPTLVDRPIELIGTFAHEIAHGLFRTVDRPPPGGGELEEFAVELMTVYFGFGLFGANKAFQVRHKPGFLSWFRGVSITSSGYISQEQWALALAVFLSLRGENGESAQQWLSPVLKKMLSRALAYLDENPDRLARLRP